MSLRVRVLLGMGVIAIVLAVSAVVITRATRAHLVDQVDARLQEAQPQVRGLLTQAPGGRSEPRFSDLYVGVISRQGGLTTLHAPDLRGARSPLPVINDGDLRHLAAGDAVTVMSTDDGSRYRVVAPADGPRGALLVLGLSLDDVDSAMARLVAIEVVAVASAAAVLGLVTFWVIRLGVRPIRQMTETAGAIAGGDLSRRVPAGAVGTEAGALSDALNGMLQRIEDAFAQRTASEARLRQFVADASHELRTPVTTIRGYAEMHRTGALDDDAELDEAMRRTEQEAIRMGNLVDDLLRLARLDEGRRSEPTPVDVEGVCADAARDALAAHPERAITVEVDRARGGPLAVLGDEDGLRQVVANLVANALVHAPESAATIRAGRNESHIVVEVADQGPGMSANVAEHALERFYRADTSRSRHRGGSGLGLSIVEAIVHAHGGTVELDSSPGAGTTVRVSLPASP